jgi:1,2-diacylglycerol 3-alpha-glucosyltransferase
MSRKRLKKVNRVIAPTRKVEARLKDYGLKNPISIVPSGISLEQHKQQLSKERRRAQRRILGIREDQIVLVNLGRLGTEKNLDELVRFFSKAARKDDRLVFLIVGDGPAKKQLEQLASQLEIDTQVIFTGMVDPKTVQDYYQLGDLFVSASTSETQGLTYIEACANGLPLLCRQDPCLDEVLIPGGNGYSYSTEEEFLEALQKIAADAPWREAAAAKSKEIALTFDKSRFGETVEAIYSDILIHSEE